MFKQVYFGLLISSSLLGTVGLIQSQHTSGWTQKIALTLGIGGAATALTSLGLGIAYDGKNNAVERDYERKLEENTRVKDREASNLKLEINELKSQIKVLEIDKNTYAKQILELQEKLNDKAEQYLKVVAEKDLQIKTLQASVDAKDTRVEDFLEDCREYVSNFFSLRYNDIHNLQKLLENAYDNPDVSQEARKSFETRINDIKKLKAELTEELKVIKELDITDFGVILDHIFTFDNKFLNVKTRWKDVRSREIKSESKELRKSLDNSMPKDVAVERFRAGMDEIDAKITERYETLLLNNNSIHAQLLDLLEQRNLVIDDLTKQIEELQKPLQAVGTSSYAITANKVSGYYYNNYGYKLDFIQWTETDTGYTITFATRKNPGLTDDELLPDNTQEQLAALTGSLVGTLPKFEYNYQNCSVTLVVTLRKPIKKDSNKDDIDKLWVPISKFESYVKNWERIRITAGSTGGKSPTAKNLALAIMKQRKGQSEIKLYDPQHGSKKDYWDMPKAGTSHEDNVTGMAELCDELDRRTKTSGNHPFILYIFDEVDSTIAQERENNGYYYFRDKVTYSLKQASHQNIGAIYIGQACDASTIPGMSWSDWNNAVQLHIGANAGIWLDKAKTITGDDKTKLLEQYRRIQEFCDRKNEELGLDIFTDPGAYRFALAVPLTGLPKFIQLPDFDAYDYWQIMEDASESESEVKTIQSPPLVEAVTTVLCPHCGSNDWKRNGKDKATKSIQRYKCNDCGKEFTELDVFSNSN
ncbi:transposase-like zinc-binding domain-containing protein [Scytonema sp. PCC 10023]|uniref:IS1/IS1595 family N-terminal zinc-binding domain-containing protein n=1 Tax=Scytonema sp. PCC 10023 TaxID=1680591 RepID=UPI0039C636CD